MRFLLVAFLRVLQFVVDVGLWAVVLALLVRLALALYSTSSVNNFFLVAELRQAMDPALREIGSWVGLRWPSPTLFGRFLPLAVAIPIWAIMFYSNKGIFRALHALAEAQADERVQRRPASSDEKLSGP